MIWHKVIWCYSYPITGQRDAFRIRLHNMHNLLYKPASIWLCKYSQALPWISFTIKWTCALGYPSGKDRKVRSEKPESRTLENRREIVCWVPQRPIWMVKPVTYKQSRELRECVHSLPCRIKLYPRTFVSAETPNSPSQTLSHEEGSNGFRRMLHSSDSGQDRIIFFLIIFLIYLQGNLPSPFKGIPAGFFPHTQGTQLQPWKSSRPFFFFLSFLTLLNKKQINA